MIKPSIRQRQPTAKSETQLVKTELYIILLTKTLKSLCDLGDILISSLIFYFSDFKHNALS